MTGPKYPQVYEGKSLDKHVRDPLIRAAIRHITVTNASTMLIDIAGESIIAVTVRPPATTDRSWTAMVEHTLTATGETTVCAEDMPIEGIGPTRPPLPHPGLVTQAVALAGQEVNREEARLQSVRQFTRVLQFIAPGAALGPKAITRIYEGGGAVGWERRGGDVIITLQINAGPFGPTATELGL